MKYINTISSSLMRGFTSFDGDVYYLQPDLVKECPIGPIGETEAFPDLSGLCASSISKSKISVKLHLI
jgi:hypothetical protein